MNNDMVNRGWQQMEILLDEQLPVKHKRRFAGFYWLAGMALLLILISSIVYFSNSNKADTASNAAVVNSEQDRDVNKSTTSANSNLDRPAVSSSTATTIPTKKSISNNTISQNQLATNKTSNQTTKQNIKSVSSTPTTSSHSTKSTLIAELNNNPTSTTYVDKSINRSIPNNISTEQSNELLSHPTSRVHNDLLTKENKTQANTLLSSPINAPFTGSNKKSFSLTEKLGFSNPQLLEFESTHKFDFSPLSVAARQLDVKRGFSLELYIDGIKGGEINGASLGVNLVHAISSKFALTTGLEFSYFAFNKFEQSDGMQLPSEDIFINGTSYSGFLANNDISSAEFISSVSSIFVPIGIRYNLLDKINVSLAVRPGVQVHQNISYAPVSTQESSRNPSIDNGKLSAKDFFYQKSVAVVQSSIGINYQFAKKFSLGGFYHLSFSDYGRSVQYSSISKLEQIGANEVDRRFYSIETKKVRPNLVGLRLTYRF